MGSLDILKQAVDKLKPDEFAELYQFIHQHPRSHSSWGAVPADNIRQIAEIMRPVREEAETMSESEVDQAIDQAISGVRHERKAKGSD